MPDTPIASVESNAPNMRFGAGFLDYVYHQRAVNGETMMDKRTGEIIHKRKGDGKLLYYAQENIPLNNYITQIKTFMVDNTRTYIRPTENICPVCEDTYFMTHSIDLIDFTFNEDLENPALLRGDALLNPYPEPFSIIQETNAMFIQLNGRPRDRATISYLTAIYDRYYKNYEGTDPDALAQKALFAHAGYLDSQANVNYTITYYDADGLVYAQQTADAYVRFNEVSYVPFRYTGIYSRSQVAYVTMQINSISTPKLALGGALLATAAESEMLNSLLDNADIGCITCTVGCFAATSDPAFTLPTAPNSTPLLLMSFDEFEMELDKIGNVSGATGIEFSVQEPDDSSWMDINLWGEVLRDVYSIDDLEETGAVTVIADLEQQFGGVDYHSGNFVLDESDLDGYLIKSLSAAKMWTRDW